MRRGILAITAAFAVGALGACADASADGDDLVVSGSSTVYPTTQTVARESGIDVDMAAEGTTDGFERFCSGQSHINNASEAIPGAGQPTDYVQMCADNGVEYIELPIALDALSVVRHIDNDFATTLTLDELRQAWAPDSDVTTWSDLRPAWPDEEIDFVGRPEGSGTFEYFTHQVTGEVGAIREDYRTSDDMVELAGWVADDVDSLGFMGAGNYLEADEEVRDVITTVAVDGVEPSLRNAQDGTYEPLTRPLFIYVSTAALEEHDDAEEFVEYYLEHVYDILPRVYFYRLPAEAYDLVRDRFDQRTTGSMLGGDPYQDVDIVEALSAG